MAGGIKWDAGKWEAMRRRLDKLAAQYPTATMKAAGQVGQQVIHDAINITPTVPVRTGNLRSSGTFEAFPGGAGWRSVRLVVGFNTPYAARVHQFPMNFREPGAGNYFLSSKLQRFRDQYIRVWGEKVARLVGTAP